jgi:exosortase A-associated hydrolase 2
VAADVFFLPAGRGYRLCVHHAATGGPARGAVLYLHPWAEEMNKARRMAAMQSRALAEAGYAVLQIDLYGCGDSSDTWAEASWEGWVDDAVLAAQWLLQRHAATPLWLWGLRAGALLAAQAAARLPVPCHFLFWQPAPSGKLLLQQFLRLKAAADLDGDAKGLIDAVRQGLAAGQVQDVAGYPLSPALARGLEAAVLAPPPACTGATPGRLLWLEVSNRPDATLLPASAPRVEAWRAAGHPVQAQVVPGPAFWQTVEIEDAPALIPASLAAMHAPAALLAPPVAEPQT